MVRASSPCPAFGEHENDESCRNCCTSSSRHHPFSDGNKRIGSLLFVEFLHRNGRLIRKGQAVINDVGLAALALLVADSAPKHKEVMIRLVMNRLAEPAA